MSDWPEEEEVEQSGPIDQDAPVLTGRLTMSNFGIIALTGDNDEDEEPEAEPEVEAAVEEEEHQEEVLLVVDQRVRGRSSTPPPRSPAPPQQQPQEEAAEEVTTASAPDDYEEDDVGPLKQIEFRPPPSKLSSHMAALHGLQPCPPSPVCSICCVFASRSG